MSGRPSPIKGLARPRRRRFQQQNPHLEEVQPVAKGWRRRHFAIWITLDEEEMARVQRKLLHGRDRTQQ